MIVNGIDLSDLTPHMPAENFPDTVPGRTVHIDADFLAYMVSYEKTRKDAVTGKLVVIEPIKLEDMYHNCSVAVEKIRRMAGAQFAHLHLTPGTSTKGDRPALAIQKEYQANRKDKPKPDKLHIMRDWMARNFPSTMNQFAEADDSMAAAQYAAIKAGASNLSVICSKDKDLMMVAGLHLDWDSGKITRPTNELGHENTFGSIWLVEKSSTKVAGIGTKFFWAQMLMGDTADNIQGLPLLHSAQLSKPKKVGPVLTNAVLCNVDSDKEAFQLVKGYYEAHGNEVGYTHWLTQESVPWQKVLISEMQMLWMRRDPTDANDVLKWIKEITQ